MAANSEVAKQMEEEEDEEEDLFQTRIDNSGCSKYHYALQVLHFVYGIPETCLDTQFRDPSITKQKSNR